MKKINVKGQEYILMPPEYINDIKDAEDFPGMFSEDADIHIQNVGQIICYPELNFDFDIYEPVSNEYELDNIYTYIENNISEDILSVDKLKSIYKQCYSELNEKTTGRFSKFKKLYEELNIEFNEEEIRQSAIQYVFNKKDRRDFGIRTFYADKDYIDAENKMKEYINKGSDPERVAKACKNNYAKLTNRYVYLNNNKEKFDLQVVNNWLIAFKKYIIEYAINNNLWTNDIELAIETIKQQKIKTAKFEEEVSSADTSKFIPTARDWEKMIDYMNKKSNPERLAASCKDPNKVVARFIIANTLGWESAILSFKQKALDLNIATKAELEAYARKYALAGMPEEYAELVNDLKTNDSKGGISMNNKDTVNNLPSYIYKALDNNVNIIDYTIKKEPNIYGTYTITAQLVDESTEVITIAVPRRGYKYYSVNNNQCEWVSDFNYYINKAVNR